MPRCVCSAAVTTDRRRPEAQRDRRRSTTPWAPLRWARSTPALRFGWPATARAARRRKGRPAPGHSSRAMLAGSAQIAGLAADAPVRVLADGEGEGSTSGGGTSSGTQSATDLMGAIQVGWLDVEAPIRVMSAEDESSSAGSGAVAEPSTADQGKLLARHRGRGGTIQGWRPARRRPERRPARVSPSRRPPMSWGRLTSRPPRVCPWPASGLPGCSMLGLLSLAGGAGLRLTQR